MKLHLMNMVMYLVEDHEVEKVLPWLESGERITMAAVENALTYLREK